MKLRVIVSVAFGVLAALSTLNAQTAAPSDVVRRAVSIAEIQRTLEAFDTDRTSGKPGERRAAEYLAMKLTEYGIKNTTYEARLYMSWPVAAEVAVTDGADLSIRGTIPAFGASTPPGGLTAETVLMTANQPSGRQVRGRIVIVEGGGVSPDRSLALQQSGAAGIVQIEAGEIVHEMIATTIWGSPTTESAMRIPTIPIIAIKRSEGDRLKASLTPGSKLRLTTKVEQGWSTAPLVVADVVGRSPDFVLVATHIDAWYRGMTDTAGTNASILEMARVLQAVQSKLKRGVRFAWWPGHSFGRYAGSTWYVDRFWADLDQHCVAYTNLDGSGRRGSQMEQIAAGGWPGILEYSREFAQALVGKAPAVRMGRGPIFRPGRDSDSSFQGIGIPEFSVGVPGPLPGHPDLEPGGRISYWHTAEDTLDKIDPKALELDTQYRVAQLFDLATRINLPLRVSPIATSFQAAIDEIATAAGAAFNLKPTQQAVAALLQAANRLDATPRPANAERAAAMNSLLVRLTHRLNSRLYTKTGRFDQDPAASVPVLPLLARAREMPALASDSDAYGFLETELLRGRNAVEATFREATRDIEAFLASTSARAPSARR
jgi:hypothetical protein